MASHGGARNRSGPVRDPNSARSERAGFSLAALPNEGFQGDAPEWPLGAGPDEVAGRELAVWAEAWTTPQAAAWALEPWRWQTVAMWVRTFVICEGDDAKAADKGALHRFADQIGLTPAGLVENGWQVAPVEVAQAPKPSVEGGEKPQRRMRAV